MAFPLIDVPGVRLFISLDLGRSENSALDIAPAAFATAP